MKQKKNQAAKHSKSREESPLKILIFLLPFAFGLYYEFAAYLAGAVIALFLLVRIVQNRRLYYARQAGFVCLTVSYLFYLITALFAVDRGMALAGFFKVLPVVLFLFLLLQFERETVRESLKVIPYSGLTMLVLSAITWFIPPLTDYFYNNGRLGGFFQYSNTFALYLLLGMIILGNLEKKTRATGVKMLALFAGVLLTGSRTIFVFCLLNLIVIFIRDRSVRKPMLITSGIVLAVVLAAVAITGSFDNIGRFMTISLQESTFVGRLLYDKDGLQLLLKHPFGLGYYGYYYLQPSIQTGVYTVRFIHNDWLQFALDAGILGAVLNLAGLLMGVRRSSFVQKQLFATIVVSSLLDFNLQFMVMPMMLMLTLDFEPVPVRSSPVQKASAGALGLLGMGLIYFAASFGAAYFDAYETAAAIYPGNTEAKITALQLAEDRDTVNRLANEIIGQNKNIALAYDAKATVSLSQGDYDSMIAFKKKAIENKKYDIEEYEIYLQMLSSAITAENNAGNRSKVNAYADEVYAVPAMLNKVKAETDPLAYQINDKPELELSEVSQAYIIRLQEVLK